MKLITKNLFVFFAILALCTSQLKAEPGEFHFGVDGGLTYADTMAEEKAQELANLSGSTVTVTYDTSTWAGRIYGDYGLSEDLNIELGWMVTGSLDNTYTIGANSASESYTMSIFDASLKFGDPFFIKGGIHQSTINGAVEITVGGTTYDWSDSITGTGWLLGGGMEVDNARYGVTYIANLGGDNGSAIAFGYYGFRF